MGNTALHTATFNNNIDIVKLLLQNKADITKKNCEQKTCLELAEDREFREIQDILDIYYQREMMWRNRNCLIKLFLNKENTIFKNLSYGVFKEIIKYA